MATSTSYQPLLQTLISLTAEFSEDLVGHYSIQYPLMKENITRRNYFMFSEMLQINPHCFKTNWPTCVKDLLLHLLLLLRRSLFFRLYVHLFVTSWTVVSQAPWSSLGKNTGVGCCLLLQGTFLDQGWNLSLLHWQVRSLLLGHQGTPHLLLQSYFIW